MEREGEIKAGQLRDCENVAHHGHHGVRSTTLVKQLNGKRQSISSYSINQA